ncbi:EamA-like transporter family protein [Candidatus Izimaplasma bacterium HR1]|jgi:drug/metabolite transporter (DMT)-like permease|uniref:DMT family transporter n=1 Tax=Candidatus Izimoplasma sp. HR1 TaxID=1541959 RepID=UPI0004F6EE05|nr:EamA-like transporter family protein [Candidatus Izimaplasma bacterium HR1]
MNRTLARIVLVAAGLIWGFGFYVNKTILDFGWTESELLFVRFFTATIAIFALYFKRIMKTNKETIKWGVFLGVFLYLGFYFQTWGLANTTPSNNALITAGYIVLMPGIIYIFERKHIHFKTILAGIITLIGILFITVNFNELESGINFGDSLTFIGAFFYAIHIYFLGKKAKQVDLVVLMAFQLLLFSVVAFIVMVVKDGAPPVDFQDVESVRILIYAIIIGFFASFVAFIFQSIGQKNTNEAEAAILISTESLFGPLFAVWLYGDIFSNNMGIGMALVLIGIILSELDIEDIKRIVSKKVS